MCPVMTIVKLAFVSLSSVELEEKACDSQTPFLPNFNHNLRDDTLICNSQEMGVTQIQPNEQNVVLLTNGMTKLAKA